MLPNLPRHVQVVRAKGTDYLYFRRHGQRWRLPHDPTSLEFQKAYLELLGKTELDPEPHCIVDSSVAGLIRDYRSSEEFLRLKKKTQRDYGRMLDIFAPIDHHPAHSVRRRHIRELSKTFAGKRRTQKLFGQVASVLFNFAVDNDYAETNPASRMNCVGRPRV